jgi:hypothetical protein
MQVGAARHGPRGAARKVHGVGVEGVGGIRDDDRVAGVDDRGDRSGEAAGPAMGDQHLLGFQTADPGSDLRPQLGIAEQWGVVGVAGAQRLGHRRADLRRGGQIRLAHRERHQVSGRRRLLDAQGRLLDAGHGGGGAEQDHCEPFSSGAPAHRAASMSPEVSR